MTSARADLVKLLVDWLEPALAFLTPDDARLELPHASVVGYDDGAARFEGYARQWWGAAPLRAGGAEVPGWSRLVAGLARGPALWGEPRDLDQRLVDTAPLAWAVLMLPELQAPDAPHNLPLRAWFERCLERRFGDSNRRAFAVLIRLAHEALGGSVDEAALLADLQVIDRMADADGAWHDGHSGPFDHYASWALVPLTLAYAHHRGARDPTRAARWRAAAVAFAPRQRALAGQDGMPIPFGRSLGHRCAGSIYWSALARFGGPSVGRGDLGWGALRGLALAPIAAFARHRLSDDRGLLTMGWTHAQPRLADEYSGPWSPYWMLMAGLPLAFAADHPFWTAPAEPLLPLAPTTPIKAARAVAMRGAGGDAVLLASGHAAPTWLADSAARYAKLAYSSRSGFGLDADPQQLAVDGALVFRDLGGRPATRREADQAHLEGDVVVCDWRPLAGVRVRSWLVPCPPWHVRVHRIDAALPYRVDEGGFLVAVPDAVSPWAALEATGAASPERRARRDGPRHLAHRRPRRPPPGPRARGRAGHRVCAPRALVPVLEGRVRLLRDWLACAVIAHADALAEADRAAPTLTRTRKALVVKHRGEARRIAL
ncbi:MAG: DUF2264 domain-containing protein [Myxococcota bacterium]